MSGLVSSPEATVSVFGALEQADTSLSLFEFCKWEDCGEPPSSKTLNPKP